MTDALDSFVQSSYALVDLSYGSGPTVVRYTNSTAAVVDGGNTYASVASMRVIVPENTGALDEKPLALELPLDSFMAQLVGGKAFPPVSITARLVISSLDDGGAPRTLVVSTPAHRLSRAIRNPDKRRGLVRLEFLGPRARVLNVPLGISCNPECAYTLGDKSCQIASMALFTESGIVAAVDRKTLTLDTLAHSMVAGKAPGYWRRGTVSFAGLTIGIRDWVNDSLLFELTREPPASWAGVVATFVAGCDGKFTTCRDVFANEEHFGGLGIKMPTWHPVLESP